MSFGEWLAQAWLLHVLRETASGQPISQAALAAQYSSPNAFGAAFRQVLGQAPSRFFHRAPQPAEIHPGEWTGAGKGGLHGA